MEPKRRGRTPEFFVGQDTILRYVPKILVLRPNDHTKFSKKLLQARRRLVYSALRFTETGSGYLS